MANTNPESYQVLMASLGSMLSVWSKMEQALTEEIRFLHSVSPDAQATLPQHHGIAAKIRVWQGFHVAACDRREEHRQIVSTIVERLNSALELRNALCHGFYGANITPKDGENHLYTALNGIEKSHSFNDLTNSCEDVNRAIFPLNELSHLSTSTEDKDKSGHYANLRERLKMSR